MHRSMFTGLHATAETLNLNALQHYHTHKTQTSEVIITFSNMVSRHQSENLLGQKPIVHFSNLIIMWQSQVENISVGGVIDIQTAITKDCQ